MRKLKGVVAYERHPMLEPGSWCIVNDGPLPVRVTTGPLPRNKRARRKQIKNAYIVLPGTMEFLNFGDKRPLLRRNP